MAKELTLEEALEQNASLKAENASLKEENEALKAEIAESKTKVMNLTKEVPGTFTYKGKEAKNGTYKFKKGCLSFILKGKKVFSEEIIKDKEIMIELIEDGFGLIELVND